jgi:hypothetical protein
MANEYTTKDKTLTFRVERATVGVTDKRCPYRVDRVNNVTGSWNTMASGLTRQSAEQKIEDIRDAYEGEDE